MLLLWQQTPPSNGLLLFRRGSSQQGYAQLQPDSANVVIQDAPDGWNFAGSVANSASGSLVINDSRDAWSISGNVKNSGALSVNDKRDAWATSGNLKDSGALSIADRKDTWFLNGTVTTNSAAGALVILDRPDGWVISGNSASQQNGATNYWGRIKEKHHLHPDAPDYSKAIAEAIRNEQLARAEKQRLEKELKAVKVSKPTKPPKQTKEAARVWVDPTKELRRRIEIQDTLIAQARSDELALRLQAVQAERVAKQNQEQEDILLILMALDD